MSREPITTPAARRVGGLGLLSLVAVAAHITYQQRHGGALYPKGKP